MTVAVDAQRQTLESFDWQWAHLAQGDFMPGDPWFDAHAAHVLARELCAIDERWFVGKRVLDAGCGQGRWTRALLELGAEVIAIDFSEAGLERTRALCAGFPRLHTRRVNLLDIPDDLARERFDLVFSFGVLHHTGDTRRALANIAGLVADAGALFLYLYGADSWTEEERARIERARLELASVPFEEKIETIRRRFPGEDPHQLFDLLSPTINDRVRFEDVAAWLRQLAFADVQRTIEQHEVYALAIRPGFPAAQLLDPVGRSSEFARESGRRWNVRLGARFEDELRAVLSGVRPRPLCDGIVRLLRDISSPNILDVSLPPDAIPAGTLMHQPTQWSGPSPITPNRQLPRSDIVTFLGGAIGACRFPDVMLETLSRMVTPGGTLVIEMPREPARTPRRGLVDKVLDYGLPVPKKVVKLLRRRRTWSTGDALHALGGSPLLPPITAADAEGIVREAGARDVEFRAATPRPALIAHFPG